MLENFAEDDEIETLVQRPLTKITATDVETPITKLAHRRVQHIDADAMRRRLPQSPVEPPGIAWVAKRVVDDAYVKNPFPRRERTQIVDAIRDQAAAGGADHTPPAMPDC